MEELIDKYKVIICAGSGGVGKTTVSASLAVVAAQKGLKVLVMTIDPAKRLATSLGLQPEFSEAVRVPQQQFKGELFASLIDPQKAFESFVLESANDSLAAKKVLNNALYKQLSTTLSGSQEFTSLDRLFQAVNSGKYDLVILDTPPAQHAVDFLNAPQKIFSLFQKSIVQWFMQPEKSQGWLRKVINKGTQTAFLAFEKVTGADFIGQLAEFFSSVQSIQERISQRSIDTHKLLMQPSTGFVVVTSFDKSKMVEAEEFYKDLKRGGYSMAAVVVNRAFPEWQTQVDELQCRDQLSEQESQQLNEFYAKVSQYYREREDVFEEIANKLPGHISTYRLPELIEDVSGLAALEALAETMKSVEGKDR